MNSERKKHWEKVYETKSPNEVSWTQKKPVTSLEFIKKFGVSKDAKIIDIGGGDSMLVDYLLELGYTNITVLDISAIVLEKAKVRLGEKAAKVIWIVSDITSFQPTTTYNIWHDRATFHFLTEEKQIAGYKTLVSRAVNSYLIIGTFSTEGPKKCSGLDITQYNEDTLRDTFKDGFEKLNCSTEDHTTPFNTIQNFIFCSFKKNL